MAMARRRRKRAVRGRSVGHPTTLLSVPSATAPLPTPALAPIGGKGGNLALLTTILVLGLVSAWLVWRGLVQPYLLTRYVNDPLLDLGKIGGYDPDAGRRYTAPLIALWLAYLAAWWLATRVRGEWSLRVLALAGALGGALVYLWLYPITAADIFNYLIYGLVQHRGQNPLVVEPRDVIAQPLIGYSAWPFYPSPYGPLWQGIAWAVTAITGERLLAGVLGFKLVLIGCHLLNMVLIDRIAAGTGLARPGVAALVYGWNPFILYETAGNGHNDIVMLTGLLLALWLLLVRRRAALVLLRPRRAGVPRQIRRGPLAAGATLRLGVAGDRPWRVVARAALATAAPLGSRLCVARCGGLRALLGGRSRARRGAPPIRPLHHLARQLADRAAD